MSRKELPRAEVERRDRHLYPPPYVGGYAGCEKSRLTSTATGRSTVRRTCLFSRQSACKDTVFPPSKFSSAPHSPQGDGGVRCHHADGFHRRLRPAHLATGKPVYWMIDLGCTRARLLAEIETTKSTGEPLNDIADPRVATADAHVRVWGRGRKDLFPLLKIALCERFASVPRPQLIRDLLMPLKNALGNAFKHGNGSDLGKRVSVEIMLTRKGALLAVTDEGTGFDFARTFRRFQQQETYFENHGSGFRNLHQAMSTVAYENGGRTVLLCFRPTKESLEPASRLPALEPVAVGNSPAVERSVPPGGKHGEAFKRAETTDLIPGGKMLPSTAGETPAATFWRAPCAKNSESSLAKLLDGEWMRTSLSTELPEFANGGARLESCRIYPTGGRFGDDCGNRYLLRVAGPAGGPAETLDSWLTLSEYLTYRGSFRALRKCAGKIGQALAALHGSPLVLPSRETDPLGLQERVASAEKNLQTLSAGSDLVNRLRLTFQRILQRAAFRPPQELTPIHGALSWDCIRYGVDGRFYLYRFETCRRSDPGLDLGGWTADLLCFTLANHDEEAYRVCFDHFVGTYNSEAAHSMSNEDLLDYTVLALVERLGRAGPSTHAGAGQLLAALDIASTTRTGGAKSEGT